MEAQQGTWEYLRKLAKGGGLYVLSDTIRVRMCEDSFVIIEYESEFDEYTVIDRFVRKRFNNCGYQAAEECLHRVLMLPKPIAPAPPLVQKIYLSFAIKKYREYFYVCYKGSSYFICTDYVFVRDKKGDYFVARGEQFGEFRHTDEDIARLLWFASR